MNKEIVYQLLQSALSGENVTLAQEKLLELNKQPLFSTFLIDILLDQSIPSGIRLSACITFKNIVKTNWRKKANVQSIISDQERVVYKEKLLFLISNSVNPQDLVLTKNVSNIIGMISRIDYPQEWPNLLTYLLEVVEKSNNQTVKISALDTIKCVVNELASRRVVVGKEFFANLSKDLFNYFNRIWLEGSKVFIKSLQDNIKDQIGLKESQQFQFSYQVLLLVSKILRRLIEFGFTDYEKNADICQFYENDIQFLNQIMNQSRNLIVDMELATKIDHYIYINQKIMIKSQHQQPCSFIKLLPITLNYFTNQVLFYNPHSTNNPTLNQESMQRVMAQSTNYLKSVVDCTSYQSSYLDEDSDEKLSMDVLVANNAKKTNDKLSPVEVAQNQIKQHFNYDCLAKLLKALVSNYLIIDKEELERWESAPEDYLADQEQTDSDYQLKPSGYDLFIILMRHFHTDCVAIDINMLEYVTSQTGQLSDPMLLLKEACYMTIGLGYHELYDKVNFNLVFSNLLINELKSQDPRFKIIKRRILWLMSYWVGKIPAEMKNTVVEILLEFLNHQDLIVSLTAGDALKAYIDDWEFSFEEYTPYLEVTLQSLLNLFKRCEEVPTKTTLLSILGVVFLKFNQHIKPYSASILNLFVTLWDNGDSETLLKSSIVRCLSFFLQALNSDPQEYYSLIVPLINVSTDPNNEEERSYILEDGLELWYQTIIRVPNNGLTQEFLQLFANWIATMELSFENTPICFKILDAYLLLGQVDFLRAYGQKLVSNVLEKVIGDIEEDLSATVIKPLDRIISILPVDGTILLEPILYKLFTILVLQTEDSTITNDCYTSVFSRLLAMNPMGFFQFVDKLPLDTYSCNSRKELYSKFFTTLYDKIDSITTTESRKLLAIGLCNLLIVQREELLEQWSHIITFVVGMKSDIQSLDDEYPNPYCDDGTELPDSSGVDIQSKALESKDPIKTVDINLYLLNKIQEASNLNGPAFQSMLSSLHPKVLELALNK
ncbi:hypothetical protein CYY_002731 [Polysphondylium violaceum]|uniref:Importin N-terminal domain-containing protein n=1 Tax=Polysphondylium violaceum TaxID=133409 RepID=A0A8J4V0N1_9MYCE|nr:hypothetical protein CYY_002731 [Polysphondylium violaceum]